MAAAHPHALQDTFLEHVRKHDVPVTVFLANGIRLQGTVAGFDSYSLLLVRDRHSQLIYKHAISTVVPSEPDRMAHTESERWTRAEDSWVVKQRVGWCAMRRGGEPWRGLLII